MVDYLQKAAKKMVNLEMLLISYKQNDDKKADIRLTKPKEI